MQADMPVTRWLIKFSVLDNDGIHFHYITDTLAVIRRVPSHCALFCLIVQDENDVQPLQQGGGGV